MVVISRTLAAVLGGYLLANVFGILFSWMWSNRADGVVAGIMVSFIVYTVAVMWVFYARKAWLAWAGLLLPSLLGGMVIYLFLPVSTL